IDRDERLGEAIEAYLAEAEEGSPPDPEVFAARYPDLSDDLRAALDGLALVRGLVGDGSGPGHRLESGRRIAGYRIVRELGRGGMGTVYEAVHVGLDRPVALKVLGSHAAPDSSGRRRFLNEARTAAGLHHTHIVPVVDVAQVGREAAEALAHAHRRGIIHRDVKPSNLLVDARGVVWMADFGLARRLADPSQTQQDSLLGTPRYMSPEQARIGPIDGRSDIYSLGATLYELLTLRPPFEGRTAAELVEQIGGRDPVPP